MTPNSVPHPTHRLRARLTPLLALMAAACGPEALPQPAGPDIDPEAGVQCPTTRDFFSQQVWPGVLGTTCIGCHGPGGVAVENDAAFKLLPSNYPGFIEANLAVVEEISRKKYDDISLLLAKPMGLDAHGGGTLMSEGDPSYRLLSELIDRLKQGDPCDGLSRDPDFARVEMLDPAATYRKATLHLAGRLPTDAEQKELADKGEEALTPLLDALMKEDAFFARLKEMFNDIFLTDRYFPNEEAVNLLNREAYPLSGDWYDAQDEATRRAINRGLAREPLELLAHIVRNGKPFSEILTAKYTVVNPFTAQLYGMNLEFKDPTDENEWQEAEVILIVEGRRARLPHAGILTNPMWLNRFPTSDTNRNRHRARNVMQQFLATDILKVAERPIDPLDATKYNNPTRDDPSCASCHRQLDPIAGAFMQWDNEDQEEFVPTREWYKDMFAPGYADELMPVQNYGSAQRWLGARIVADPRFTLSIVRNLYTALTGHTPLEYPSQAEAGYTQLVTAWEAQDRAFRQLTEALEASKLDLRVALRGLVLSPYFRAANVEGPLSEIDQRILTDVGTGRLSIPELMDRKVYATVGFHWARDWNQNPYLRGDFGILYGGIDSNAVTTRLTAINSVMTGVQWRMANEVACSATAFDFTVAKKDRQLLKYVDLETTPIGTDGADDPAQVAAIKQNIQHLHERFWGTRPALDDPELLLTYGLFLDTWREGLQGVAAGEISESLSYRCMGRVNPQTGEELPEAQRIGRDPRYTVRAWMAVLTYLMSDYQFLYE